MLQRSVITVLAMAVGAATASSSSPKAERETLRGGRNLQMCSDPEKVFRLDLTTDDNGSDTEYIIEQYDDGKWEKYVQEKKHEDNVRYNRRICIAPGDYRLTFSDAGGACYTAYLMGNELKDVSGCGDKESYFALGQSQLNSNSGNNDNEESSPSPPAQTPPAPEPTPLPTPQPTPQPVEFNARISSCASDEYLVTVEFKLDAYGEETTWTLKNAQGTTLLKNSRTYGAHDFEVRDICLPTASNYALTVRDPYDGICCEDTTSGCFNWRTEQNCVGYYKMSVNGNEVLRGGKYIPSSKTHVFNLEPHTMTDRDQDWLDSHNSRRKQWHKDYGKDYVPLKWSNSLKVSSQGWARQLLNTCGEKNGLFHDSQKTWGENLASNFGSGSFAAMQDPDQIVGRFVEWEQDWEWPANAHLTQVLWRGSHHVGCADASTTLNDGSTCHVQVCRYARAGNCDMSTYNDGSNEWWMDAVMKDEPSRCGNECPPEGCHYY